MPSRSTTIMVRCQTTRCTLLLERVLSAKSRLHSIARTRRQILAEVLELLERSRSSSSCKRATLWRSSSKGPTSPHRLLLRRFRRRRQRAAPRARPTRARATPCRRGAAPAQPAPGASPRTSCTASASTTAKSQPGGTAIGSVPEFVCVSDYVYSILQVPAISQERWARFNNEIILTELARSASTRLRNRRPRRLDRLWRIAQSVGRCRLLRLG